MVEAALYPSVITTQLYQVVARKSTTLTADVDSLNTNLAVTSTSGFPATCFISVNNETMLATVLDGTNFTISRGYAGVAASHDEGDSVKLVVAAASINRIVLEVVAIQTYVGTSGGAMGYVNARYLNSKTEALLSVSAATYLGGSTRAEINPITTKGDIIVGATTGAIARKAVGSDGTFLKALSTEPDGLEWGSGSTGYADKLGLVVAMGGTPDEQVDVDFTSLNHYSATNVVLNKQSGNLTIDNTASGANGIDTGAVANSTWYYIWSLLKADGTNCGVFSLSATFGGLTLPADYLYGRCVGAIRTNGTADFIPGTWQNGWFFYTAPPTAGTVAVTATWTDIDCSQELPIGISKLGNFSMKNSSHDYLAAIRQKGSTQQMGFVNYGTGDSVIQGGYNCPTDSAGAIQGWTQHSSGVLTVYLNGYKNIE